MKSYYLSLIWLSTTILFSCNKQQSTTPTKDNSYKLTCDASIISVSSFDTAQFFVNITQQNFGIAPKKVNLYTKDLPENVIVDFSTKEEVSSYISRATIKLINAKPGAYSIKIMAGTEGYLPHEFPIQLNVVKPVPFYGCKNWFYEKMVHGSIHIYDENDMQIGDVAIQNDRKENFMYMRNLILDRINGKNIYADSSKNFFGVWVGCYEKNICLSTTTLYNSGTSPSTKYYCRYLNLGTIDYKNKKYEMTYTSQNMDNKVEKVFKIKGELRF
ncbi:MAG: hypothetical protein R2800_05230 [Flavipsychrobacter sp.]